MAAVKAGEISEKDKARYKRMFDEFDINKDGVLSVNELADALQVVSGSASDKRDITSKAKVCIK